MLAGFGANKTQFPDKKQLSFLATPIWRVARTVWPSDNITENNFSKTKAVADILSPMVHAWPLLQILAVKNILFVRTFGGEKPLGKCR